MKRLDQCTHGEVAFGAGWALILVSGGLRLVGADEFAADVLAYGLGAHIASSVLFVWEWWIDRYDLDECDDDECACHEDDDEDEWRA